MTKFLQAIFIALFSFSALAEDTNMDPQGSALEIFQCNFIKQTKRLNKKMGIKYTNILYLGLA